MLIRRLSKKILIKALTDARWFRTLSEKNTEFVTVCRSINGEKAMPEPEFIIYDCDGVLVDSEYLCSGIYAHLISKTGYAITANEIAKQYSGLPFSEILKSVEREKSVFLSEELIETSEKMFKKRIKSDLLSIEGVKESVRKIGLPYCVCSNSASDVIKIMLKSVYLYDLFKERIFSAPEVGTQQSKPEPDVFLHAAHYYRVNPERVVVLEDSVTGITGAVKAGMRGIGFTGGRHAWAGLPDALIKAGAQTVISRHADMKAVIKAMAQR